MPPPLPFDRSSIQPGDRLCVALSGGADSVALLLTLHASRESLGIGLSAGPHPPRPPRRGSRRRPALRRRPLHPPQHSPAPPPRQRPRPRHSNTRNYRRGRPQPPLRLFLDPFRQRPRRRRPHRPHPRRPGRDRPHEAPPRRMDRRTQRHPPGPHPPERQNPPPLPPHPPRRHRIFPHLDPPALAQRLHQHRHRLHPQPHPPRAPPPASAPTTPISTRSSPISPNSPAKKSPAGRPSSPASCPQLLLPGKPVRGGGRAVSTAPGHSAVSLELDRLRALDPALRRRVLRAAARQLGARLSFDETARLLALCGFGSYPAVGAPTVAPRTGSTLHLANGLRADRSPRELRLYLAT